MRLQVVDGDQLFGVDPAGSGAVLAQGTKLPGTRIYVSMKGTFRYRPLAGPDRDTYTPLCSEADHDPPMLDALVFEGDLYDPVTKKITVGPVTDG